MPSCFYWMNKLGMFMKINNSLQITYKASHHFVTFSLLLFISPIIYAQQLFCNPSCNNTSGGYISETQRDGELILNDVSLNSIAPAGSVLHPGDSKYSSFAPIVIALGVKEGNYKNLHLNATGLTIDTTSTYANHARAIAVGSNLNDATSVNLMDSSITLKTTANASSKNTIGILMEADTTGQIYSISLKNTDMHISSEANNNTVGGIWAYANNGFAETNVILDNSNITVESASGSAYGIRTENKSNPSGSVINIQDVSSGAIKVTAYSAAYGISIDTIGKNTSIDNKSDMIVNATGSNSSAYGINARTRENTINTHAQNITVKASSQAYGINTLGTGNQTITNTANISVESSNPSVNSSNQAIGIFAQSTSNTGDITITTGGDITVRGNGVTKGISASSQGNSTINVSSQIDAGNINGIGIASTTTTGENTINLSSQAKVMGGNDASSAGIFMKSTSGKQQIVLAQGSELSSLNDMAISGQNSTGNTTVNNNGRIIGRANLSGNNVVFNNQTAGILDLKNFSSGSKSDIIYTIGTSGGVINNAGLIKFADENFDGTTTNAIFNVATLTNSGIIDLTGKNPTGANNLVGDTFTINGNYVSDGGSIYLNTLLDDASSNGGQGTSDLIIVNGNVTTSSGATNLYITPTASTANLGQLTTGNGIKVVEVQGTSSSDAFQLGRPVVAGAYEYTLGQGQSDDSWYLSSYYKGNAGGNGIIQYNPAIGAYLANQTAAVQMFQQTLFDRLISSSDGKNNDASKSLFWMRTKMTHGSYDSVHGQLNNRNRSYSLQMGGDLNVWALDNGGYFHLGMMAGYGDAKNTNKSDSTGTKTDGKVKGYTTGVYGTYFANQDTNLGLYVDLWSQMGWYRNEISGEAQQGTKKYNSTVWSNSVELGYGIPLTESGDYQWLATPQAQFTYNHYDADNQHDKNNLSITNNNASGLDTRLGVRFHARGIQKDLIEPFIEVNWLDTTAKNELDFNGKSYKDGFAKDRLEAKIGLQGNINKQWSVSAQMGGQWGNNSFSNYQGQLNVNYKF
ncbi:autotransporter outer membrane beta-barrel domain-containing protein [Entomomonas moraniae]|uniref:Autotransporter outer membrane beta-barrel domain-containing protein n=2 Tax=Entomomonas moraniae TaxID=2213226 RepID=A0A3S9XFG2_9GAMM|nr:autotransporter outer membrane beta-barrel domain-containing protein [Entomomonas moraniae]